MKQVYLILLVLCFSPSLFASDYQSNTKTKSYKQSISPAQYVSGGVVGSFLGLGLGHAAQGRWTSSGIYYTGSQLAGTSLFIYGMHCTFMTSFEENNSESEKCSKQATLGFSVVLISRIFEVVDLWSYDNVRWGGEFSNTSYDRESPMLTLNYEW